MQNWAFGTVVAGKLKGKARRGLTFNIVQRLVPSFFWGGVFLVYFEMFVSGV
jgi:hypothetical protein